MFNTRKLNSLNLFLASIFMACLCNVSNADVYLNNQNMTVALGASMAAEPFQNQSTEASLMSIIDAAFASSSEDHNQSTHVWVSGGVLEIDFDLLDEYDISTVHFWNYFEEGFDVDNVDFTFFDAAMNQVGTLNLQPQLGGSGGNPIFAEDISVSFPTRVRFINAFLSGTNDEADFNNMGFTGITSVPEPVSLWILGFVMVGAMSARRRTPVKS